MKTVAVLGGGPAGAFAAERLAKGGLKTILFDEKLAWEKPCGGGLTYKAYQQYPFLVDNDTPKKFVSETTLSAPRAGAVKLALEHPLVIYSRMDLNRMLLDRAEKAGTFAPNPARHRPTSASSQPAHATPCATSAPSGARTIP